ncbi:hypothetical protein CVT26_003974 [Gymnopilus dilepis]|uniref:ABM domain-containing protein n=1 Tax=Gymnopilus dilepis TaxID=231916 RepID=A0A409WYG9_9AGAR|nr:hypothetical protein CVT26_003974 [Gymnopilus dilepis]
MPVVEIAWWTASDAFVADKSLITPGLDFLKKVEGCNAVYSGFAVEENTYFLFLGTLSPFPLLFLNLTHSLPHTVWETLQHHKDLIAHPQYPQILGLGPTVGEGGIKLYHVAFQKDFTPALSAPFTEILAMNLKEGKTKEGLEEVLDKIASGIDKDNTEEYRPVTRGATVEEPEKVFYLSIGWKSPEFHKQIVEQDHILPDILQLREFVDYKLAYLADPNLVNPVIEFLKTVDGVLDTYIGIAEEENTLFAFVVWESLEHHITVTKHPEYPQIMQLGPCIASAEEGGSGLTLYHVDFIKPYTPSQSAPTTEVLAITLKEGKTKADLWRVLEAITAKIDEENPKYAPVTWGQTLEDEKKFYLTIGWDSSDAHRQIMGDPSFLPYLTDLRATAALKMVHVSLKRPALL